jgi:hypothetical protein
VRLQSAPGCRDALLNAEYRLGTLVGGSLNRAIVTRGISCKRVFTGRSGRLRFQLIVGGGAEIVLHLVLGVGFLLTAFAVFDFGPTRWLPWVGCLSIGALGVTFLLQGISQLLHNDWLTYLAFQILWQQVEAWSGDVFLVWCGATVLLMGSISGVTRTISPSVRLSMTARYGSKLARTRST